MVEPERVFSVENGGILKEHHQLTATAVLPEDILEGKNS
jgi:hypothetical protein